MFHIFFRLSKIFFGRKLLTRQKFVYIDVQHLTERRQICYVRHPVPGLPLGYRLVTDANLFCQFFLRQTFLLAQYCDKCSDPRLIHILPPFSGQVAVHRSEGPVMLL